MNLETKENKVVFLSTGLIGIVTNHREIIEGGIISNGLLETIIRAGIIAFISGFLGLCGKKFFEFIWKKITKK